MYCTDASFKIKVNSNGLVVGYTGTQMTPICCVAISAINHSGLLLLMMAILSDPSGVKSFPDKPRLNKPALKAFTVDATCEVE